MMLTAQNARLLFIVDNDYGELTMLMYFLYGQQFASRTTLLLPPRLHAANQSGLPVRTLPYRSYHDIVKVIEEETPHIVFLFSGYVLPLHKLLSVGSLARLVRFLRDRGCRVVTYDPFWGLMPAARAVFANHLLEGTKPWPVKLIRYGRVRFGRSVRTLTKTAQILNGVTHIQPAPMNSQKVPTTSFFNPLLKHVVRSENSPSGSPYWLFLLSSEDYRKQRKVWPGTFTDLTAGTLQHAIHAGRRAILLAPDDCIAGVKKRLDGAGPAELLTFCSFERFVPLLLEAEYVFYWNIISSSSLIRLINGLPVFYFDRGHVGEGLPLVYEFTVELFFRGWNPLCLDQRAPLELGALEDLAAQHQPAMARIRANLETAPTPEDMIDEILGQTVVAVRQL
jgi:hypothetical protein